MSYPPLSGYYNSSVQSSSNSRNGYSSSSRNANNSMYSGSVNNSTKSTQPSAYSNSAYEWSGQSAYSNTVPAQQSSENYPSSDYGYQRSGTYDGQASSSVTDPYSQDYYGRSSVGQSRQLAYNQNEGLSGLAYVSGLESANPRSSTTRSTQPYEVSAPQQQNRVRSPVDSLARYPINPPSAATSYTMRQQASSSSTSSNQLAVDAAAALAGAVGRRNASNVQHNTMNAARESPQMNQVRSAVTTTSRQTVSPRLNHTSASRSHQPYVSNQSQQQLQQRPTLSRYNGVSPEISSRQLPANNISITQSQHASQQPTPQHRTATRSSPRSVRQTGSIAHLVTAEHESEPSERSHSPEISDIAPTFIDPTSIFDPYAQERERRRQAVERAAIEAKKQAEEDATRKAAEEKEAAEAAERERALKEAGTRRRQVAAKSSRPRSKETPAPAASVPQTEEERMAAELKAMMEKMKAFQSKDPSLFKKLWDDMRKPGPAVAPTIVDTPSPQTLQQTSPAPDPQPPKNGTTATSPTPAQSAEEGQTPKRSKRPKLGADGQPMHLNGYPVVVENNPEGLPDLGRFPAERRIRHSYAKRQTSKRNSVEGLITAGAESTPTSSTSAPPLRSPGFPSKTASSKGPGTTPAALSQAYQTTGGESANKTTTAVPNSGTIWPLEKRNALTSTALRALKAIPQNLNVPLTEDDLQKMLENNPSYIDLCQLLEAKGLTFHRGHFARELLNSVPDLKSSNQAAANTTTASGQPGSSSLGGAASQVKAAASAPPPGPPTYAQQQPLPPVPQPVPQSEPAYSPYYHYTPTPQYGAYPPPPYGPPPGTWRPPGPPPYNPGQPYPPGPGAQKGVPRYGNSSRPEPPPGSKEAAARKRDFSELIDLTELGDDDNYVVPDKHPRLEGPDSDDETGADPFQAYRSHNEAAPISQPLPYGVFPPPGPPLPYTPNTGYYGPPAPRPNDVPPVSRPSGLLLAKPLNREEALKKQFYDPKTVARDILIATGRHPSERPLNVHLAGMLGKYIELDSDVDTFEWDEVDPGGHPVPKVEVADVPASKPRFKLGERVAKKNRKMKVRSAIDKTRGLDKEKHAKDAAPPTDQPAPQSQNGVTSKTPPTEDRLRKDKFKKPSSNLRHSLLASDEQATPAQFDPTRPPVVRSDRSTDKPVSTLKSTMSQDPVRRRPGRPPGAKNKFPSVAGLKAQASDLKVKVDVPLRQTTPAAKEKFKCKWKKCSTVLHNLDTLRKHIGRIHRPNSTDSSSEYICWWKKCKYLKQDEETGEWITTKVFDHWEDWLKHIEKEHVTPIALRWGDGPATSQIDPRTVAANRKLFLSDINGLETTPTLEIADNHQYPPDVLNLTELDHRALSTHSMTEKQKIEEAAYVGFMRAHGINIKKHEESREASREVLRSLSKRKEMIGAGIDRGGCTLVNEAMREGFEQNPGIWRVVGVGE